MIKINSLMVGIIAAFFYAICNSAVNTMCTGGKHIYDADSLSVFIPCPFHLMGCNSSAPQEVFR